MEYSHQMSIKQIPSSPAKYFHPMSKLTKERVLTRYHSNEFQAHLSINFTQCPHRKREEYDQLSTEEILSSSAKKFPTMSKLKKRRVDLDQASINWIPSLTIKKKFTPCQNRKGRVDLDPTSINRIPSSLVKNFKKYQIDKKVGFSPGINQTNSKITGQKISHNV